MSDEQLTEDAASIREALETLRPFTDKDVAALDEMVATIRRLEAAEAEAMALVLNHEGRIDSLNAQVIDLLGNCHRLESENAELRAKVERLTARGFEDLTDENARLREAVEHVMFDEWGYRESEAPDMQDELTRLGLLVEVPADEAFKREWDADTMFTFAWSPLAAKDET